MGNFCVAKKGGVVVLIHFIIVTLIVAVTTMVQTAYAEDESIEVSCYKGNTEEGNFVGSLTVTRPANAVQDCNATYYDCDGTCVGCYYDPKLDKKVCFDKTGENVPE